MRLYWQRNAMQDTPQPLQLVKPLRCSVYVWVVPSRARLSPWPYNMLLYLLLHLLLLMWLCCAGQHLL